MLAIGPPEKKPVKQSYPPESELDGSFNIHTCGSAEGEVIFHKTQQPITALDLLNNSLTNEYWKKYT